MHVMIHFASSLQETNVLGFKGPRKMTVILPGMTAEHQRVEFKASVEHDSLIGQSTSSLALCVHDSGLMVCCILLSYLINMHNNGLHT